jgi:hypothetical protein
MRATILLVLFALVPATRSHADLLVDENGVVEILPEVPHGVGEYISPALVIPVNDTHGTLNVTATMPQSEFNSSGNSIALTFERSFDNGATWECDGVPQPCGGGVTWIGPGTTIGHNGLPLPPEVGASWSPLNIAGQQIRVHLAIYDRAMTVGVRIEPTL